MRQIQCVKILFEVAGRGRAEKQSAVQQQQQQRSIGESPDRLTASICNTASFPSLRIIVLSIVVVCQDGTFSFAIFFTWKMEVIFVPAILFNNFN